MGLGRMVNHDTRLAWREHTKKMIEKHDRGMRNVMRGLAVIQWGTDTASSKHKYVSSKRSRLEYGNVVYGSAA